MQPSTLLDPGSIALKNAAASKKRVLEEAASLLAASLPELESEVIFERLLERERLGSTGVGQGVALPHARIDGLSRAYGAFIQLAGNVDYDAIDGEPVDLVYALVVPRDATEQHLQLLAALARMFSQADLCRQLRASESPEDILAAMSASEVSRQRA